jgi:hypothetical protein
VFLLLKRPQYCRFEQENCKELRLEPVPKLIDYALNAHGFGTGSWKNRQKPGFSITFKEAVPKTEVLEQPHCSKISVFGKIGGACPANVVCPVNFVCPASPDLLKGAEFGP